jgi:hypothetical protein
MLPDLTGVYEIHEEYAEINNEEPLNSTAGTATYQISIKRVERTRNFYQLDYTDGPFVGFPCVGFLQHDNGCFVVKFAESSDSGLNSWTVTKVDPETNTVLSLKGYYTESGFGANNFQKPKVAFHKIKRVD